METVWLNGEYLPLSEASVPLEDRALQFADGIYEVIAAENGHPILLREHLERMERSARGIALTSPHSSGERERIIARLLRQFPAGRAMVYGQLTRGSSRRTHAFPSTPKPTEYWYARPLPPLDPDLYCTGVALISHPDERWARCWIKSTCLLPNVLAKQAALEKGAFDALLHHEDGTVTETSAANAYLVRGGTIYTHPENGRILGGCKRSLILRLAAEDGIPVHEKAFTLGDIAGAEELFISSTTLNALPARSVDDRPVGDGRAGPVAQRIGELIARYIQHEVAEAPVA